MKISEACYAGDHSFCLVYEYGTPDAVCDCFCHHGERPFLTAAEDPTLAQLWDNDFEAIYDDMKAKITEQQFAEAYAARIDVPVEWLREHGRKVVPCDCGEDFCEGWQMSHGWMRG